MGLRRDPRQQRRQHEPARRWLVVALTGLALSVGAVQLRQAGTVRAESGPAHVCPMHPEVRSPEPGSCPKCSMPLEPTTQTQAQPAVAPSSRADAFVDPRRVQRIGVRTEKVVERPMTLSIRAPGRITFDDTRVADISIRYPAWIGALHVNRVGQHVRKGEVLFTLYSYELYMAQRELRNALELDLRASGISQVDEARRRLRRLNVSAAQIDEMSETKVELDYVPIHSDVDGYVVEKNVVAGAGIAAGQRVYRIARLDEVWVEADVYLPDLAFIANGVEATATRAVVTVNALPGRLFEGPMSYVYPFLEAGQPTVVVRIQLQNPDLELRPGMFAEVQIDVDRGRRIVVPESAVIHSGRDRMVFIELGAGHFRPHSIELGACSDGVCEVSAGLEQGDAVVVSGNYLIAAESRLKSAAGKW